MNTLTITRPDDWHIHLRDNTALKTTVAHCARQFARAIVMPNLVPPVTTTAMALEYRQRIISAIPQDQNFNPLMTLYLTDNTSTEEIRNASNSEHVVAVKLYPAGATTHSDRGITDLQKIYPVLEAMEKYKLPLLVHGEVTDPDVDIFDREKIFIERCLIPVVTQFPALRVVFEHITTKEAADFVRQAPATVAATITAHHLMLNRNDMLAGGIKPHHYCLPVIKRELHRQVLIAAATSGNAKFFLGTDSAPHEQSQKESACGCAGIYTAHAAIELYASVFDAAGALDKLETFASFNGADFYGLPRNRSQIKLTRKVWTIPESYPLNNERLIPFHATRQIDWTLTPLIYAME
jgi:dihydroorotase